MLYWLFFTIRIFIHSVLCCVTRAPMFDCAYPGSRMFCWKTNAGFLDGFLEQGTQPLPGGVDVSSSDRALIAADLFAHMWHVLALQLTTDAFQHSCGLAMRCFMILCELWVPRNLVGRLHGVLGFRSDWKLPARPQLPLESPLLGPWSSRCFWQKWCLLGGKKGAWKAERQRKQAWMLAENRVKPKLWLGEVAHRHATHPVCWLRRPENWPLDPRQGETKHV